MLPFSCCADENGAVFKATEAREREKELNRLKAEAAAAEHIAQQVWCQREGLFFVLVFIFSLFLGIIPPWTVKTLSAQMHRVLFSMCVAVPCLSFNPRETGLLKLSRALVLL